MDRKVSVTVVRGMAIRIGVEDHIDIRGPNKGKGRTIHIHFNTLTGEHRNHAEHKRTSRIRDYFACSRSSLARGLSDGGDLPSRTANYLVLDEAIETGNFRIAEVSEAGTVPHLLAINETISPVLLVDGEELIGAKQNRILNLTILVPPHSETVIPVSCVEGGRWNRESAAVRTVDRVQFARARAEKVAQVSRSLFFENDACSDQLAVWDAIAAKSERMRAFSPTGAMATIYESHQPDLENYSSAIPVLGAQIGAIFAIEGSIVGLELFNASATYRKLSRKLILSYALDAMEHSTNSAVPGLEAAQLFAGLVRTAQSQRFEAAGVGESVRLTSTKVSGAALEFNGACLHLAAFSRTASDQETADKGRTRTRLDRSRLRRA